VELDAISLVNDMIAVLEKLFPGDAKIPRVAITGPEASTTVDNPGVETDAPHV
jgi:hypothetical protein